ncbi:MAG: hypothetical protein ACREP8_04730 [Candidatus Binatia bacterium]
MMPPWTFLDYWPEPGVNPIRAWYGEQDEEVQAAFDVTVNQLNGTEDWEADDVEEFKELTEEHAGLSEIRFEITQNRRKRKFRPLGIYLREQRQFIFLVGLEKSGRILTPPRAFELALDYKRRLDEGRGFTDEHV